MLTPEDIQKLKETLATKEDISKLLTLEEFDGFGKDIREDINGLREMIQSLVVSVDRLVSAVDGLKTEYASILNQVDRHEKWIQRLAEKLGVKLEY